jgi:hypothetical protein
MFRDALNGIRSQPAETVILDIFAHGHCYGRPAAAWAIDDIARLCRADDALWLTTRSEIAAYLGSDCDPGARVEHARAQEGGDDPRP